jgi:hypothetical protein
MRRNFAQNLCIQTVSERVDEGRKQAQVRRVIRFGRKLKLTFTPYQRREALVRREAGEAGLNWPKQQRHQSTISAPRA